MAETPLTIVEAPGFWSVTGVTTALEVSDVANGNSIVATNDMLVVCFNISGGDATVTITSVDLDTYSRSVDAVKIMSDGTFQVFRITKNGWSDSNNLFILGTTHASLKFFVIDLKGSA